MKDIRVFNYENSRSDSEEIFRYFFFLVRKSAYGSHSFLIPLQDVSPSESLTSSHPLKDFRFFFWKFPSFKLISIRCMFSGRKKCHKHELSIFTASPRNFIKFKLFFFFFLLAHTKFSSCFREVELT